MGCPLLKDYVRECVDDIGILPKASYTICHSNKFDRCPFYIRKNQPDKACKNVNQCYFFNNYTMLDFDKFLQTTAEYCLSPEFMKCMRYIRSEKGEVVPKDLHPNGKIAAF